MPKGQKLRETNITDALTELLTVMVGAPVVPLYPIIVLMLLQSPGGLGKAVAFVSGGVTVRLAQGILFGLVLGSAMTKGSEEEQRLKPGNCADSVVDFWLVV